MFSEEYKRDNEMVKPSKEFLEKLKVEMKKEEKKKKKYSLYNAQKILVIAAVLAIVFISVESYKKFNSNENSITQQAQVSNNVEGSKNQGDLFNNSNWYDSEMNSEEIYRVFINRMLSEDDLKELSLSSSKDFTNCKIMDKETVKQLVRLLDSGSLIEESSYQKENPKYYMASFNNGDIIKFIIYDEKYFECNEFKGSYLINNR